MQDLHLVGIHEDGEHLLLADADGTRYRVAADDALRAATRRDRRPAGEDDGATTSVLAMRPRDVQALIRSGVSVVEVAERSGWSEEKVRRYEPPIRAERDYVAGLARAVQLRGRARDGELATLGSRVAVRLDERGVAAERVAWDSWKVDGDTWTVVCTFPAGGRERKASWRFDPRDKTLSASDDEARWLGEDEQAGGPIPAPPITPGSRVAQVYDVEAEGGLKAQGQHPAGSARRARQGKPAAASAPSAESSPAAPTPQEEPVDLMSAMRQRSAARKQRSTRRQPAPTDTPVAPEDMPDEARPPERLRIADAPPPPLGSHPAPDELSPDPDQTPPPPDVDPVTGTVDLFGGLGADESATPPSAGVDDVDDPPDADGVMEGVAAEPGPVEQLSPGEDADEDELVAVPARQSRARRGRPAVPSWDDIMFGTRPSAE